MQLALWSTNYNDKWSWLAETCWSFFEINKTFMIYYWMMLGTVTTQFHFPWAEFLVDRDVSIRVNFIMFLAVTDIPTAVKTDGDGRDADEGRKDQMPASSLNVETQAPQVST